MAENTDPSLDPEDTDPVPSAADDEALDSADTDTGDAAPADDEAGPEADGPTPADPEPTGDGDVKEWMSIAKRATEVVGKIDLDKVASHDEDEVGKVGKVIDALDSLERGEHVEYVPGVDEDDEPVHQIDPEEQRRADMLRVLEPSFADRLGRVYFTESEPHAKSLQFVPHRDGLPEFLFCFAPDHSPIEGAHGVFLSDHGVFAAVIAEPIAEHRWRIMKSMPFETVDELVAIIKGLIEQP